MSFKILVMSCDKNQDLWKPFNLCIEKYWKEHPEIIYSTETITNPYYKTICKNIPISNWSKRICDTLKEIDSDYILIMVDDIFIRQPVDNDKILKLLKNFENKNVASINLEKSFDSQDQEYNQDLMVRSQNGKYKTSVMCNIYDRQKFIGILEKLSVDPWTFEYLNPHNNYTYLIAKRYEYLDFGYGDRKWFGVRKGKWCKEIKEFFDKEKIDIDLSIRGFYQ